MEEELEKLRATPQIAIDEARRLATDVKTLRAEKCQAQRETAEALRETLEAQGETAEARREAAEQVQKAQTQEVCAVVEPSPLRAMEERPGKRLRELIEQDSSQGYR